jgi:regulator of protease activity HflC (stomatin/prohibitin superfamily)
MHFTKTHYRAGAAVALVLLAWLTFFSVRETEFALITQFGKPVRTVTEAGLHAKWFFPKRHLLRPAAARVRSPAQ